VPGVGVLGAEPPHVGGLTDQLGGGEHATASKRQQRRRQATHPWHQVGLELVDLGVELPHPCGELAGELGHDLVAIAIEAVEERLDRGQVGGWGARQRPGGRRYGRVELMEVPAQPVDDPGPLGDQVVAVVDQQPELAGGPVQLGGGQLGLPLRRPGHGKRVDRVGLAVGPGGGAGVGHELGRDPHDLLAGTE
jgi:hypothetical protein